MRKTQRNQWVDSAFSLYRDWTLHRHFHSIHLLGNVPTVKPRTPLLLLPNHSSWWDGFFIHLLNRKFFQRPLHMMMLEEQLRPYSVLSRLGAYPINTNSQKAVMEALRHTVNTLQHQPSSLVCVFPQGTLLPWHIRPLGYRRGIEHVLHRVSTTVTIVPLAIRCETLEKQRPKAYFLFGSPVYASPLHVPTTRALERTEEFLLNDLQERIITGEKGKILLGRKTNTQSKREQTEEMV